MPIPFSTVEPEVLTMAHKLFVLGMMFLAVLMASLPMILINNAMDKAKMNQQIRRAN